MDEREETGRPQRRTRTGWGPGLSSGATASVADWIVHPPLFAVGMVLLWALVAWGINTAQYGDHLEQFGWAQSLEWGYHKHPPLPTWLLGSAVRAFGLHPWWPTLLAALCIALNLLLTWRIGCWLLDRPRAALAVLLAGLQQGFAAKSQLFNHNSVMVACISLAVWLALRAAARPERLGRWVALGLAAGLALLAKYQSALPLLGVLVALGLSGGLAGAAARRGAVLAVVLALALFVPHLLWVAEHGWTTLAYASQSGVSLTPLQRLRSLLSFLVIQLRIVAPALVLLALLHWRLRAAAVQTEGEAPAAAAAFRRSWLIGLVGVPVAGVVIASLLGGLKLQDHWGIQTFQYLGLGLAALWPAGRRLDVPRAVVMALMLHLLWFAEYASPRLLPQLSSGRARVDQFHPAEAMARTVEQAWQAAVGGCPLRYVRGPNFESGLIGVYGHEQAATLDIGVPPPPWLDREALRRDGHVAVRLDEPPVQDEWAPGAVIRGQWSFDVPGQRNPARSTLHWMIVPPAGGCGTAR